MNSTPTDNSKSDGPQLRIITQYSKSIHFENLAAQNKLQLSGNPDVSVNVNVSLQPLSDIATEVTLKVEAVAVLKEDKIFSVSCEYAAIAEVSNFTDENKEIALSSEIPRFIFPFLRNIISTAVLEANYPPLLLAPIDFFQLYKKQAASQKEAVPTTH